MVDFVIIAGVQQSAVIAAEHESPVLPAPRDIAENGRDIEIKLADAGIIRCGVLTGIVNMHNARTGETVIEPFLLVASARRKPARAGHTADSASQRIGPEPERMLLDRP